MLFFDQLRMEDRRLRTVSVSVLSGMGVLLCGLWYVQVIAASQYVRRQINQSVRTVRLPPVRGKILDRNGRPLAESRACFNINLYLEELRPYFAREYGRLKELELDRRKEQGQSARLPADVIRALERDARYNVASGLALQISRSLGQPLLLREAKFNEHYQERRYAPLPILSDISMEQVARFLARSDRWPGAELELQPLRTYPGGKSAAHILGYVRRNERPDDDDEDAFNYPMPDYEGAQGVEKQFDAELRGRGGKKTVVVNHEGYRESEEVWPEPVPGKNVVLAIDLDLQRAAEKALGASGPETRGAAVVMDVNNGDLLAVASAPAFDPNQFVPALSLEEWNRLNDPELTPLVNRASQGIYPPGSTFKIVVALACLEAGVLDPHEIFQSKGYFKISARARPILDLAPAGPYDFKRAFMKSSNSYFIEYGLHRLGPLRLIEMGRRFHFGQKTGFLLSREEQAGYFPAADPLRKRDGSAWRPGDTANLSIGQGEIAVTPLQLAVMTAAVANGGTLWQPRLALRVEPQDALADDSQTQTFPPRALDHLALAPENLALVRDAMLADVEDDGGTGKEARVPGFPAAGKTGTAQVRVRSKDGSKVVYDHITWFVSFAPYAAPRYAVVVMVASGRSGGRTCAPVARKIYEAIQRRDAPQELAAGLARD